MRKIILLLLLLPIIAWGQNMGTIELNENMAATLKFHDKILPEGFCTLGNNPQIDEVMIGEKYVPIFKYYDVFVDGNTVMFRLADAHRRGGEVPKKMTLTIKLNDGTLYNGFIITSDDPQKSFYDYTGERKVVDKEKAESDSIDYLYKRVKDRLSLVLQMKDQYYHMGAFSNGMTYQIANIYNDDKYSYFKINIKNATSNDYVVDAIQFRYDDQMKRKIRKKEVEKVNRIVPFVEIHPGKVPAYSTVTIGYAVPLFSTTMRGMLDVKFLEKNGNRNADIFIKAYDLQTVEIFKKELK